MFHRLGAGHDPPRMTAPRSGQTRISRTAAHLVGVEGRIASTVFGTITAMATVAAYGRAFPDSPWTVEELVLSTAVVLWIAHVYTHGLSESLSEGHRLRVGEVRRLAGRELGILLAVVPPTVALLLGAFGVLDETASIWLALGGRPRHPRPRGRALRPDRAARSRRDAAGRRPERRPRAARRPAQGRGPALKRSRISP